MTRGSILASLAAFTAAPALAQAAPPPPEAAIIDDVVTANRILADQEILDGFGHVSARSQRDPNVFWLSRSRAPGLVVADDVMAFGMDGEPIDARGRAPYLERFIHSEIYKVRPDVQAIVHSHAPAIIPFGVSTVPLRPIFHIASFLPQTVPIFEIRDTAGPSTDLLVRNPQLGAALAHSLADAPVVLMRGHGCAVVGKSVHEVVFRSIYTVVDARLESDALRLGGAPKFLTPGEAAASAKVNAGLVDRPWEIWKAHALGTKSG
ncbi:MAG: class II aldolase/adducin family protein [Candidatus Eremiobacteraeota bacterium]|nr:class II aldolase/adducin family protein [Candidatus Eremiobacteraeota bacterium]